MEPTASPGVERERIKNTPAAAVTAPWARGIAGRIQFGPMVFCTPSMNSAAGTD
jgi:hypothetical protein